MRPFIALILGITLMGFAALALRQGPHDDPLELIGLAQNVGSQAVGRDPVTILIVPSRQGVASVRAAVDSSRIVAATPDGFAVDRGRVVAADHRAASELLMRAGWTDRAIRIAASPARADEVTDKAPAVTPARIAYALWAALALGSWIAWRAAGTIGWQIRGFFRGWLDKPPAPPETVIVLRVDTAVEVAAIRAALPISRVLEAMPRGLVLSGGWIVTAGEGVASDLVSKVGWQRCILEPLDPDPFGSISRRTEFISESTGLEITDLNDKATWSVDGALEILLSDADWRKDPGSNGA